MIELAQNSWSLTGIAAALLVVLLAGILLYRAHTQRAALRALINATRRIADGQLDTALPNSVPRELRDLQRAIEDARIRTIHSTESREFLEQVVDSITDSVILTDVRHRIIRANPATMALLGYSAEALAGITLEQLIPAGDQAKLRGPEIDGRSLEVKLIASDGQHIPVSLTRSLLKPTGRATGRYMFTAKNVSERKLAEQRIRYLARMDALTRIPNRMQFQHLLQRAIARARRNQQMVALIYLDLDDFKDVNDTFGHTAGDACLEAIAGRLTAALPDPVIIGRLAGDEFGIVLDGLELTDGAREHTAGEARRLLEAIAEPLMLEGHQLHPSASAGIAFYPSDAGNVIDMIRNADAALLQAKRQGGNTAELYHADLTAAAVDRLIFKSRLRSAFGNNELRIQYLPKIDLRNGRVAGAEALVRWELAGRGLIMPDEFIPLAEESDLILELGEWVLSQVCRDYCEWQSLDQEPGRISVNLSLRQLRQRDFIERIRRLLAKHGLPPSALELEITESTLMEDTKRTVQLLSDLQRMGLTLAIDDFGTGYSSLAALQQFPVRTLKIDRSFVREALVDPDQATIVSAIVEMGHSLALDVVAEGVETEAQLRFLRSISCDFVQGLLFGEPMSAEAYAELLDTRSEQTGRLTQLVVHE